MTRRKLVLTVTLGIVLAIGLLVGLNMGHHRTLASTGPPEATYPSGSMETPRPQSTVSTVHVVVRFADKDTIVRPVTFTQPITAYAALRQTGLDLDVVDMGWGLMVCGIEGVGRSLPDDSGCDNGTRYWGTSYWGGEHWVGRIVGVDTAVISRTGHIEAFSFSDPSWIPVNPPPAPPLTAAADALAWLQDQQQEDGGYGSLNDTAEALMAVGANRIDATTWRHGDGPSLLANATSRGAELAGRNAAGVGKLATGLAAQESHWPVDAVRPRDYFDPTSGTYHSDTLYHAWGMLGTKSLSETVPVSATEVLKDLQLANGGWEWAAGLGADTNDTALALQALIAAGEPLSSTSIVSGFNYLKQAQNNDGGFPYSPDSLWGTASDTNSTAYVLQALIAAGQDPLTNTWTISDATPISFLLDMQLPDGSFEWQKGTGSDPYATRQAIPALLHRPFPLNVDEVNLGYGISGQVVSNIGGAEKPLADVTVEADGADDLFFATTDATGAYTISLPSEGTYSLKPVKEGFTFVPVEQAIGVSGDPGDVSLAPDFVGEALLYLPFIVRH